MKKTSRRNSAKTKRAAAVALSTKSAAKAQTRTKDTHDREFPEAMYHHQDTPPSIEILDGSLIVESTEVFDESGNYYTLKTDPVIKHIRVLAANSDKIYEDIYASEVTRARVRSSVIDIVVANEDGDRSTVNVKGGVTSGDDRVFQIKSDKKLNKAARPQKKRRRFKYDHEGNRDKEVRIESIEITNVRGGKTKFTAAPTGRGDDFISDEFRIMIWR
jgi:hypothetical protein